jgi:hypothetical protein
MHEEAATESPQLKPHASVDLTTVSVAFVPPNTITQWQIVRPRVHRWLQAQYVAQFFLDGSLRLSSFRQFARHKDEHRKDEAEGRGVRVGLGNDSTIFVVSSRGDNCYILCGTTNESASLQSQCFGDYDACFIIDNPTLFAQAVAMKLPQFSGGFDGACIYREDAAMMIMRDIGDEDLLKPYKKADGSYDMSALAAIAARLGGFEEMLVKRERYAVQREYRFVWSVNQPTEEYIDVKVPEAHAFCRRIK